MIRQILCDACAAKNPRVHPEDAKMGWKMRQRWISSVLPQGHGLTINGAFTPMDSVQCDLCGIPITGQVVIARTQWRGDDEPLEWESEYGSILPAEAVNAARRLSRFIVGLVIIGTALVGCLVTRRDDPHFGLFAVSVLLIINAWMLLGICGKHR